MAQNSLSPGYVKLFYKRDTVEHTMVIPTKFYTAPTPGSEPSLLTHAAGQYPFEDAVNDLCDFLLPISGTNMTFDSAEVWYQPTPADDPLWIFTVAIDKTGTFAGTAVNAGQLVMTFRSNAGGLYRLYLMESAIPVNQVGVPAEFTTAQTNLSNYVKDGPSWIYARDNGYPIVCLGFKTKTNDVLRRRLLTG